MTTNEREAFEDFWKNEQYFISDEGKRRAEFIWNHAWQARAALDQRLEVTDDMVERAWKVLDDALNGKIDGQEYAYGDPYPMRAALQSIAQQVRMPDELSIPNMGHLVHTSKVMQEDGTPAGKPCSPPPRRTTARRRGEMKLSYNMSYTLKQIGSEWGPLPPHTGCTNSTLQALEKRGLIEMRIKQWAPVGMSEWEVRRTSQS